jgi:outer membrane protein insertion porin family
VKYAGGAVRLRILPKPFLCVLAVLIAGPVLVSGAVSQSLDSRLRNIRVEGAQRVEADTIRSYMGLRTGDTVTSEALDKSLKALFATGLFADVTIRRENPDVVVRIVENPIINRLAFEGNKRTSDEILRDEVKLRPRVV